MLVLSSAPVLHIFNRVYQQILSPEVDSTGASDATGEISLTFPNPRSQSLTIPLERKFSFPLPHSHSTWDGKCWDKGLPFFSFLTDSLFPRVLSSPIPARDMPTTSPSWVKKSNSGTKNQEAHTSSFLQISLGDISSCTCLDLCIISISSQRELVRAMLTESEILLCNTCTTNLYKSSHLIWFFFF